MFGRAPKLVLWFTIITLGPYFDVAKVARFYNVRRLIGSSERVSRSREIIMATNAVVASLLEAETGERGYLITGAQDYLVPYDTVTAHD